MTGFGLALTQVLALSSAIECHRVPPSAIECHWVPSHAVRLAAVG